MRKLWIGLILSTVLLFYLPFLFVKDSNLVRKTEEVEVVELCPVEITVQGMDKPLQLEDYVKGVVAAEMPVTFHEEALAAQAIAARTYALKVTDNGNKPIAADVSAQVFASEEERKKRWGKDFKSNEEN